MQQKAGPPAAEASDAFEFTLNGERQSVSGLSTQTTLSVYLRRAGLTGTKEGCAEGDCGACTVAMVERDASGKATYRAINSCIALLPMVAGRELVTVEGLARGGELHPVQQAMVESYGSQCGYCTPGFCVSMFEAYCRSDVGPEDREKIGDQLAGNLCRCTGYRPIRDAAKRALEARARRAPDLFQLRLKEPAGAPPPLAYEAEGSRFLRPTSLRELLRLRAAHPEAELVAGATEIGVYLNKQGRRFPFLVSTEGVPELRAIDKDDARFRVGGAATLTDLEEAMGGELPAFDKMLWVFASRQIRSRATLAGNLVTASPIGDMAPLLLASGADVVLASTRGERRVAIERFFLGYRKPDLEKDEIVLAVEFPRKSALALEAKGGRVLFESYKVSKRRELDIAIVSAGFFVALSPEGRVLSARLGFGGVAATPSRARKTEAFLLGRAWDEATLAGALSILAGEFSPIDDVRSGAAFRRGLVASLFEKFFRGEASEAQEGSLAWRDALAHEVGKAESATEIGRDLRHESARGHVTGAALYVDDQAQRRGALVVWPVLSKHAHARVVRLDVSEAEKVPGIACVLTADDVPGKNDVGAIRHDEPLLARGEILFHGQMVAAVVGESEEACRRAAALVSLECEPLAAILSAKAAREAGSFHTEPHVIARGDAARAIGESPLSLSGELEIGGQEHFYLETQAAFAEAGDDGDVFVVSSTQHPSEIQAVVSHVTALPRHKVVVQSPRMGGAFGGKETQGNAFAALVALAALRTKRPARMQLDRDVDMIVTGKRHPFFARFSVGFDAEGRIRGADVELVSNGGYALDLSESICDRALFHLDNAYYLPAVRFSGRVGKTHVTSHTAFRGFGGPQGMVVIEEILDRVARTLGLAPEVVRAKNLYGGSGETNTTHYGQELEDGRIRRIWSELEKSAELEKRRASVARFNAEHPHKKRGIAITPVKFGISFTATFLNQAGALVLVYRDGSVQVNHGGTEMGQGLYTKIQGIAMRELGLPEGRVRVMKTQTDKVPNTSATAASSGSDLNGAAVRAACVELKARLAPIAAELLAARAGRAAPSPESMSFEGGRIHAAELPGESLAFEEAVEAAYVRQVSLSATGFYRTPGIGYDKQKGKGKPFFYFAYGAAVAEVEVDGYTGMKRVLRVDVLHDVGDSLNPGVDRGQVEGGFVQGMGWLTGEELKWHADGRLLTHSASTYQIPSIGDAPPDFRVRLLDSAAQPGTIHGSKAVGEPPLMLALSVREAIRDAVAAFGEGKGEVHLACPATHEAIFEAIQSRRAAGQAELSAAAEE